MEKIFSIFKRKPSEKENFWILDIGNSGVKLLGFRKEKEKILIQKVDSENFEFFDVFNTREFEIDVMKKAISKLFKRAQNENFKIDKLILSLPVNLLRARVSFQRYSRAPLKGEIKKSEKEKILESIFKKAERVVGESFAKESGILPGEIQFLSKRILETKMQGYKIPDILGVRGSKMSFKILVTFLPKYYLKKIKKLIGYFNFEVSKIFHEAEGFGKFLELFSPKENLLFLDIGADFTQIFLVKKGILEKISEFEFGGKNFSQALCQNFGISFKNAEILKERYQKGLLEITTKDRLKEIFEKAALRWFFGLKEKLGEEIFLENIFLFGGGALLSEIGEILEENYNLSVKILNLKELPKIETKIKIIDHPKFYPALLLTYVS